MIRRHVFGPLAALAASFKAGGIATSATPEPSVSGFSPSIEGRLVPNLFEIDLVVPCRPPFGMVNVARFGDYGPGTLLCTWLKKHYIEVDPALDRGTYWRTCIPHPRGITAYFEHNPEGWPGKEAADFSGMWPPGSPRPDHVDIRFLGDRYRAHMGIDAPNGKGYQSLAIESRRMRLG